MSSSTCSNVVYAVITEQFYANGYGVFLTLAQAIAHANTIIPRMDAVIEEWNLSTGAHHYIDF